MSMKKRWITVVAAVVMVLAIGATTAFAADATSEAMPFRGRGFHGQELTEEQKAAMETAMAERKAKLDAFTSKLTTEQKALYDAMTPVEKKRPERDTAAMEAKKAEMEAFIAVLTTEQKALYDAMHPALPDKTAGTEKPDEVTMQAARTEMEAKREAFVASLTAEQKTAWESLHPSKDGHTDDTERDTMRAEMQAKRDAFLNSLTDAQKEEWTAIGRKRPAGGMLK